MPPSSTGRIRSSRCELAAESEECRWQRDARGRWVTALGRRGSRVKVFQRRPEGPYYLAVWQPGHDYRLRSLGTNDRSAAERAARLAYRARQAATSGDGWAAALSSARRPVLPGEPMPVFVPDTSLTLGGLWTRFATTAGMHLDNEDRSRADARHRAAVLIGFFGADYPVDRLDEDAEHRYAATRRRGGIVYRGDGGQERVTRPTGPRSHEADLSLLRTMLAWATRARSSDGSTWLASNPLAGARRVRRPRQRRRPVADHERFLATLNAMRSLRATAECDAVRERWLRMELALTLAEATGRRIGAIRQLHWEDLDWHLSLLTWRADSDKSAREWVTPLPDGLRSTLARIAEELTGVSPLRVVPTGLLFPDARYPQRPLHRDMFNHWLRQAEEYAGLPKLRGGLWHAYRRKWATERKHHPLSDVAAAGGWSDLPTLMACYMVPDHATMLSVMSEPRRLSLAVSTRLPTRDGTEGVG